MTLFGREKISFSRKVKNGVKRAVSYINRFEGTAADIAISKGYDYVVCGHIHQPEIRVISNPHGSVTYMNSGDWVENLSALEYHDGEWRIYRFREDLYAQTYALASGKAESPSHKETFESLMREFELR
jgi:UDP-2,3-diacylglucosamine pyrophosphatase LpxH